MSSLKTAVIKAAVSGAASAAASPNIAIDRSAIQPVAETIAARMEPIIQHVTNTEPWWRSRVTLGALLALFSGVAGTMGYVMPDELRGEVLELLVAAGPVIGGIVALWGRWVAKQPLGT
ncbi:hypothetical protein FPY71_09960 [Aureimonas fodinaquatilis]|uniref:Holin n=1 Tax=Aureimonas fodinaquatilis TaxID=2565783 RepID=A0A5B0DZ28_9HYPH|nr:hypothetical protein [Aureimonas fodinaquatilis]KAA0970790.1 hypothetical protein FPY71_09960 [Aureimonas fodinaquatilis]